MLLEQAFEVLFGELEDANINYSSFQGINWAAYVRAEDRKQKTIKMKNAKKRKTSEEIEEEILLEELEYADIETDSEEESSDAEELSEVPSLEKRNTSTMSTK